MVGNLDLKFFLGIVDPANRLQQTLQHITVVINRKLNGHHRQLGKAGQRLQVPFSVPKIEIDDEIPVQPVERKTEQNQNVTKCPCKHSDVSVHAKMSIEG